LPVLVIGHRVPFERDLELIVAIQVNAQSLNLIQVCCQWVRKVIPCSNVDEVVALMLCLVLEGEQKGDWELGVVAYGQLRLEGDRTKSALAGDAHDYIHRLVDVFEVSTLSLFLFLCMRLPRGSLRWTIHTLRVLIVQDKRLVPVNAIVLNLHHLELVRSMRPMPLKLPNELKVNHIYVIFQLDIHQFVHTAFTCRSLTLLVVSHSLHGPGLDELASEKLLHVDFELLLLRKEDALSGLALHLVADYVDDLVVLELIDFFFGETGAPVLLDLHLLDRVHHLDVKAGVIDDHVVLRASLACSVVLLAF
jgi:hypothetical protein